jgi:DsbC/DsbD-like thiol-disulfide interchange protein
MTRLTQRISVLALIALSIAPAATRKDDWTPPVPVQYDDNVCLSYRARLDGRYLVVQVALEPGWHTFSMDNKLRAEEKLAGKKAISSDQPTLITLTGGLEAVAPWYQSPPKDFSHPELRWFSWGFEQEAVFVAQVRQSKAAPTRIAIRGQACTDAICKNIDVAIPFPQAQVKESSAIDLKNLVPVR